MDNCICSSCKNLKPVIDDEGQVNDYICEFGFPDESCNECAGEDCSIECKSYKPDVEEPEVKLCCCSACGKELKTVSDNESEGEVFCFDCYLKK